MELENVELNRAFRLNNNDLTIFRFIPYEYSTIGRELQLFMRQERFWIDPPTGNMLRSDYYWIKKYGVTYLTNDELKTQMDDAAYQIIIESLRVSNE